MNRSEGLSHWSQYRGRLDAGEGGVGGSEGSLHGGVVTELGHALITLLRLSVRMTPGQVELDPVSGLLLSIS